MNKRPRKNRIRTFGSNNGRVTLRNDGHFEKRDLRTGKFIKFPAVVSTGMSRNVEVRVFVGPSVEGVDVEYVEIASGKLSDRKPSYAR